jgi:hypothetical protein
MSTLKRRLERVAKAIGGSECTCDGQGPLFVIRFVAPGDPLQEPDGPRERLRLCPQHPPRNRFEAFDRTRGEYVEVDPP